MEEKFKSILYLEKKVRDLEATIRQLKQEYSNSRIEIKGKEEVITMLKEIINKKYA